MRSAAARALVLLAAAAAALVAPAGCGGASAPDAATRLPAARTVPASPRSHVVTIVMENKDASTVLGPGGMPYVKGLARRYGLAAQSYAITHPSLPNYLALVGGSTFGVTSDCTSCQTAATSVVDQLEARKITWRAYMEGMPEACFTGATSPAGYAKKHDPFMYFDRIARQPRRCAHVAPLPRLASDLRAGTLPTYAWISPGLCHDTHDCSPAVGDRFLAKLVPPLLRGLGPHGFLVLTWDEDEGGGGPSCCGGSTGGRIPTIVAGPDVRRGARMSTPVDHYGVLRTVQDALGLPPLRASADPVHGRLDALFTRPPRGLGTS
jgi:phosphatidylinositol-3-phosphatase